VRRISKRRGTVVFRHPVQGAAIGMGNGLSRNQDGFEQTIDVALFRKRRTYRI
jgi:hypothetical protein